MITGASLFRRADLYMMMEELCEVLHDSCTATNQLPYGVSLMLSAHMCIQHIHIIIQVQ